MVVTELDRRVGNNVLEFAQLVGICRCRSNYVLNQLRERRPEGQTAEGVGGERLVHMED